MSNINKIRQIVEKHISFINGKIKSSGWLAKMVMELVEFHQNRAQISLGKNLAAIFKDISRLTYKVPGFIIGYGVEEKESRKVMAELQLNAVEIPILTKYDYPSLLAFVNKEVAKFLESKKRNHFDNEYFFKLSEKAKNEVCMQNKITPIFTDLCLTKNGCSTIELKSTADEDLSGAKQTLVERIIMPFVVMSGVRNVFLGIISNNKGFRNNGEWKGHLGNWLSVDNFLIEDKLWSYVAPGDVCFNDFKSIVQTRFDELVRK